MGSPVSVCQKMVTIPFSFVDGLQYKDSVISDLNLMKKLNCNITDVDMIKIKANIAKIREFNTYARLVDILVEKNPFTTIEDETDDSPPKKKQKVEIVNENPKNGKNIYESEWVNWILKNTGFVDKFDPSHFVFCLNNLERFT